MRYTFTYKETFAGSNYGEYEMVADDNCADKRLIAQFGQSWIEDCEYCYGGLGYLGNW